MRNFNRKRRHTMHTDETVGVVVKDLPSNKTFIPRSTEEVERSLNVSKVAKPKSLEDDIEERSFPLNVTIKSLNETVGVVVKDLPLNQTFVTRSAEDFEEEELEERSLDDETVVSDKVVTKDLPVNVTVKSLNETVVKPNSLNITTRDVPDIAPLDFPIDDRSVNVTIKSLNETVGVVPKDLPLNLTVITKSVEESVNVTLKSLNETETIVPKALNVTSRALLNETSDRVVPKEVLLNDTIPRSVDFYSSTKPFIKKEVLEQMTTRSAEESTVTIIPKAISDIITTTRPMIEKSVEESMNVTLKSLNETTGRVVPKEVLLNDTVPRSVDFYSSTKPFIKKESLEQMTTRSVEESTVTIIPKAISDIITTTRPMIEKSVEFVANSTRALRDLLLKPSNQTVV